MKMETEYCVNVKSIISD